jgi:hypothetical protein
VSDGDRCSVLGGLVERSLYDFLGFGIESRSSFVEEENLGVSDERTGDSDTF